MSCSSRPIWGEQKIWPTDISFLLSVFPNTRNQCSFFIANFVKSEPFQMCHFSTLASAWPKLRAKFSFLASDSTNFSPLAASLELRASTNFSELELRANFSTFAWAWACRSSFISNTTDWKGYYWRSLGQQVVVWMFHLFTWIDVRAEVADLLVFKEVCPSPVVSQSQ